MNNLTTKVAFYSVGSRLSGYLYAGLTINEESRFIRISSEGDKGYIDVISFSNETEMLRGA
ncbi:hypothetical protein [Vibrio sp. Vb339]|uniref:hypothetical protein n=1 Tax=Vibrio sp. Vb339 TaxID=1192013 RepID=UPI001553C9B5|nr:hypothetical protein [Vibrio sp. Vb339]